MQTGNEKLTGTEKLSMHEHRLKKLCSQNDLHEPMRNELANYKC